MDKFYNNIVFVEEHALPFLSSEAAIVAECWIEWQTGKLPFQKEGGRYFPAGWFDRPKFNKFLARWGREIPNEK